MATYYLPSSSGSYSTSNDYVKYRIRIIENNFNASTRKLNITVQAYFYRTNSGYTTDYKHKLTYTINGTAYSYNNEYGTYPITSSGVYLNACTVDVPVNSDGSVSISVYCQYTPTNNSSGLSTGNNGGTISLTTQSSSSYTVSFNANGGTGAPSAVSGSAGSITIPSTKPTRTGYIFDGWVAQTNRVGTTNGGMFLEKNGTYLKYFQIARINPITFEILANATGLSQVKIAFWTVAGGQDDLIWHALNAGSWTRNGKSFNWGAQIKITDHIKLNSYQDLISYNAHWYGVKSADGADVALHCPSSPYIDLEFFPGDTYSFNFNTTLYAQWKANNITIKYDANGGTGAPSEVSGLAGSINISSTKPTRTGYTFMGWSAQSTKREIHTSINSSGGLTNYAKPSIYDDSVIPRISVGRVNTTTWEVLAYVVGASKVGVYTWSNVEGQDDLTHEYLDAGDWTRSGYTFNWGKQIKIDNHIKNNNSNDLINYIMHVYAYDSSGNAITHVRTNDGSDDPYYFDMAFLPGETYPYLFSTTLYAQWRENTMIVKYNANGGKVNRDGFYVGTETGTIGWHPDGTTAKHWTDIWTYNNTKTNGLQDAESFGLYRDGYAFKGWCINADGSGTILDPKDSTVVPTDISNIIETTDGSTVSLYAQWKVTADQHVYIMSTGAIYAKAFIVDSKTYIDSTGTIHAPSFNIGTKPSIGKNGVIATDFIEGTPT